MLLKTATTNDTPVMRRVTVTFRADPGRTVFLAGTFNNWDTTDRQMSDQKGDGVYCATLYLPVGAHQYKFVIDGTWHADHECADWVQNEHGTLNNVMLVV